MTISTLTPDSCTDVNFAFAYPSGTTLTAITDSDLSTYAAAPSNLVSGLQIGYPDPSLPSGAMLKEVRQILASTLLGTYKSCSICGIGIPDKGASFVTSTTWELGRVTLSAVPGGGLTSVLGFQTAPGWESNPLQTNEVRLNVVYVEQPVVVVGLPTGTVTDTNVPEVAWIQDLDIDGGEQTFADVKIFDEATYSAGGFNPATSTPVASSGIISPVTIPSIVGNGSKWTSNVALVNGVNYKAYVRIAQTVNDTVFWSAWDSGSAFDIDVDIPYVPLIAAAADSDNGRIAIELHEGTVGDTTSAFIVVERSSDGGVTWEPIRTKLGNGAIGASDYD